MSCYSNYILTVLRKGTKEIRNKSILVEMLMFPLWWLVKVVLLKSIWSELSVRDATLTRSRFNFGMMSYEVGRPVGLLGL